MSAASAGDLVSALHGAAASLITLPARASCPDELVRAVEQFDAGSRPAALASTQWLRQNALDERGSARTYVWVRNGEALAFFALSVGLGRLEAEELMALSAGPRMLPAVLLAQAARRPGVELPISVLRSTLGVAERIEQLVGVGALMLDPYDEETDQMWRRRGFRPVRDKPRTSRLTRLWTPLGPS